MITFKENLLRLLSYLNLQTSVHITDWREDRGWGWPQGDALINHCITQEWRPDHPLVSNLVHGSVISFREVGVRPSMQATFHSIPKQFTYFVELDLDEASPWGWDLFLHAGEVLWNTLTGRKTDQERISR